jgi:glycosyltransferase involved in cell wall biosynthesis
MWLYTPLALDWMPRLRAGLTVYDCMDELANFRGAPTTLAERERELFHVADLVFTGGHSLYDAKRDHHPRVFPFPSSVDAAHFMKARAPLIDPPDQADIPHPRIGFFGVIDERMDLELIRAVAAKRPSLQFVFIGPVVKIDPASLPRLPNLHWLGQKNYQELPQYIAGWNVAMMPFARNAATKFISPTKTLEYLAAGKPIVSTSIRDVVTSYGSTGLVHIADTPAAFVAAIERALLEPVDSPARDDLLAGTSWDATFGRMRSLITEFVTRRSHSLREESMSWSTI